MAGKANKLIIVRGKLEGKKAKFNEKDSGSVIEVSFNPTEYSVDKSNTFSEASVPGLESPIIQFSSGRIRTLSLELLLDTYTYNKGEDIREKYIEKLEKLVEVDGEFHAPPPCKVIWGNLEFVGFLDSLRKRYVLFKESGIPVRARVTLSFKEYVPVEIQIRKSPRSSPDRLKKYMIKEGDSLWLLSYREYGEPYYWRLIAEANGMDSPLSLEPGTEIVIPPLRVG
jgi:hypothetical protein